MRSKGEKSVSRHCDAAATDFSADNLIYDILYADQIYTILFKRSYFARGSGGSLRCLRNFSRFYKPTARKKEDRFFTRYYGSYSSVNPSTRQFFTGQSSRVSDSAVKIHFATNSLSARASERANAYMVHNRDGFWKIAANSENNKSENFQRNGRSSTRKDRYNESLAYQ